MRLTAKSLVALGATMLIAQTHAQVEPYVDREGMLHIPATSLPQSSLLSSETRAILDKLRKEEALGRAFSAPHCGEVTGDNLEKARATRSCLAESFYKSPFYRDVLGPYDVSVTTETMNGVLTEVFEPKAGVAAANTRRVLINVHGGGFMGGARTASHTESIPIAAVGRIKVVSVDYRQGPEHVYPAATDDVEAVYRAILKNYDPSQIGLYGCSAGGLLTAQTVAQLITRGLPVPGAVGMFCEGAAAWTKGDSRQIFPLWKSYVHPYFKSVSTEDPLAFPINSRSLLSKFPPSLLVSATRDGALSSILVTHSTLTALGVKAELHVWEGLGHGFFMDPRIPESREFHDVVVKFFDKHLAR